MDENVEHIDVRFRGPEILEEVETWFSILAQGHQLPVDYRIFRQVLQRRGEIGKPVIEYVGRRD